MKRSLFTIEHLLYALAIMLAMAMRLLSLDAAPLSDFEAEAALRAWSVARGTQVSLGSQPGYALITGMIFSLLGSNDTLARIFPAMVGGALAGLPFMIRLRLGRETALILAFGLALDPGLVAVSRLAGGPGLAVGFALLALGAWWAEKAVLAGVCTALGLLSGPAALTGAVGLGLAWFAGRILGRRPEGDSARLERQVKQAEIEKSLVRKWALAGGITLLLAGTLFLRFPQGLGALADIVPTYLRGWIDPSGVPATRLLVALPVYQPLAVIFGLLAAGDAWVHRHDMGKKASFWAGSALFLALLYPARQVLDLVWVVVPLWALAAHGLARLYAFDSRERWVVWGHAGLMLVLGVFIWMNLQALAGVPAGTQGVVLRWVVMGGATVVGILTTLLVTMGWSYRAGSRGLVWGVTLGFIFYSVASSWGFSDAGRERVQDWWYPQPATVDANLLLQTLGDLSEWHTGRQDAVEVLLLADQPSLRWYLRGYPNARSASGLAPGELPAVVITAGDAAASLPEAYRGTDLLWWDDPVWQGSLPVNWLRWLVFRESATSPGHVTLWARDDLFPDSTIGLAPGAGGISNDLNLPDDSVD